MICYIRDKKYGVTIELEKIPQNFKIGRDVKIHPLLKHDIDVKYRNWIIYKSYSINIKFHSRMVDDKYPQLINIINDPESKTSHDGWLKEIFFYLFFHGVVLYNSHF